MRGASKEKGSKCLQSNFAKLHSPQQARGEGRERENVKMLDTRVFHTLMQTAGLCFCKSKDTWSGQFKLMVVSLPFEISRSLLFQIVMPRPGALHAAELCFCTC